MKGPGEPDRTALLSVPEGRAAPHDMDRTLPAPPPFHAPDPAPPPFHAPDPAPASPPAGASPQAGAAPQAGASPSPQTGAAPQAGAPAQAAQPALVAPAAQRGPYAGPQGMYANAPAPELRAAEPSQASPAAPNKPVSPFAVPPRGALPRPIAPVDEMAATMEPPTRRQQSSLNEEHEAKPLTTFGELKLILKDFVKRHEKWMWWLHTAYALSLGAFVATFSQKGFERARMLTLSLAAAWLLVVFFFRFFGTGARQDYMTASPGMRRRFFVMSYLMKNLFQGMLFYLLPFYWKSSSYDAKTITILAFLGACAILSTLDLVFDRMLLRFKLVASAFFATTLFGCANVVIPALLPNTAVVTSYLVATGLAIVTFILFHVSIATLKKPLAAGAFASIILVGVLCAYWGRRAMPPVPLHIKEGGVGPAVRDDGSLGMEISVLRASQLDDLFAVTDVQVVGKGEHFRHVWKQGAKELKHEPAEAAPSREKNVVRVASKLPKSALPNIPEGRYTVDVLTDSEQIVGRIVFDVKK